MKKHVHIPINSGHITWSGKNPPTEEQMKAFNEMAEIINKNEPIPKKLICSIVDDCGNQKWQCFETTALINKYRCYNCGGVKSVFRNIYPGYY